MRLGVLSDVHGNVEALRAVLRQIDARGTDVVLVAGDLAAHGPRPVEVIEELRAHANTLIIRGNTDRYLTNPGAVPLQRWPSEEIPERQRSLQWTREQLGEEGLSFLAGLPAQAELDGCLLVHGSPGSDERGVFGDTPLERFDAPAWSAVMACGHTHEPVHRRFGERHLVNVGSAGWTLDRDPRPSFAVIELVAGEPPRWSIALERVDYDRARVLRDLDDRRVPWRETVRHFIATASVPS